MSLLAKRTQFRAARTLPFVSEYKSGLELGSILSRCIGKSKRKETAYNGGTIYQTVRYGMVELVCGREQKKKLEKISLSNDKSTLSYN